MLPRNRMTKYFRELEEARRSGPTSVFSDTPVGGIGSCLFTNVPNHFTGSTITMIDGRVYDENMQPLDGEAGGLGGTEEV